MPAMFQADTTDAERVTRARQVLVVEDHRDIRKRLVGAWKNAVRNNAVRNNAEKR